MSTALSYFLWPFVIVAGTCASDPDRHTPGEVGVRDDPIPEGFLAQLLSPFTWPRLVKESASGRA